MSIYYIIYFNIFIFIARYRVQNLLIAAMTPGPSEPTAEQLQHYMKVIVDDLLVLYEKGVRISTPMHPEGTPKLLYTSLQSA